MKDPELPTAPKSDELKWKQQELIIVRNTKVLHLPSERGDKTNTGENDVALLLHYHNKFEHISFRKLRQMAQQGIIPNRLAKCRTLACTACTYAKMTKRKWRAKSLTNSVLVEPGIQSGDVVQIRELQDIARAMLIHASKKWPKCVTTNLWPHTIKMALDVFNNSPYFQHEGARTPLQIVSRAEVLTNKKHYHPFRCPIYVLENSL